MRGGNQWVTQTVTKTSGKKDNSQAMKDSVK